MKKFSCVLVLTLLMGVMTPIAQATSNVYLDSDAACTEFSDFEIETTTIVYSMARSNSIGADKIYTVKSGGKIIAEITLSATFGYDGNTAWVTSASGSHTTYDGWSYSNEKITKSGGTATLTARLTHAKNGTVAVNTSLTCSPTGQIS